MAELQIVPVHGSSHTHAAAERFLRDVTGCKLCETNKLPLGGGRADSGMI